MKRTGIATAFTLLFAAASAIASAARVDDFQAGVAAFKAGHHHEALLRFTAARESGVKTPTLYYNLGATHYVLGSYRLAEVEFAAIEDDPEWGALAQYNLGLIARRVGQEAQAEQRFRAAARQSQSEKLRRLAEIRLAESRQALRMTREESNWVRYLSFGAGFDDNAMLADDATLTTVSDEGDYFVDVAAAASGFVAGDFARGWRLDVGGFYRRHADLDDFNFGTAYLGTTHNRLLGSWHLQAGVRGEVHLAGSEHYSTTGIVRLRAYRPFEPFALRITNDFGVIDGASRYEYLSGYRNRLSLELIGDPSERTRWRAGYQLERNDRDDLALETEFFSYSPTWHAVFGALEAAFSSRLSGEVRADYRVSRYGDDNVELELDGTATGKARDAARLSATLRLAYRTGTHWRIFGEYQHVDTDSDIDRYSYSSNLFRIGIESMR
jgi:tetratricopeptide (TPR) repeat protein